MAARRGCVLLGVGVDPLFQIEKVDKHHVSLGPKEGGEVVHVELIEDMAELDGPLRDLSALGYWLEDCCLQLVFTLSASRHLLFGYGVLVFGSP